MVRRLASVAVAMCVFGFVTSMFVVAAPSALAGPCWPDTPEVEAQAQVESERQRAESSWLDRWYSDSVVDPVHRSFEYHDGRCYPYVHRFPTKRALGVGISVLGLAIGVRVLVRSERGAVEVPSEPDPEAVSA